ncbi:hypothetical protein CX658_19735 [Pseudomonas amygdali pv. lachrymans]|nr:hypothetical protein CX658_19735 [Pseudomonas amygdali pv. lachrymans]
MDHETLQETPGRRSALVLGKIGRRAPHDSRDYRSARSSVGMPCVTLRVTDLRCAAHSRSDAERPELHATRSAAR